MEHIDLSQMTKEAVGDWIIKDTARQPLFLFPLVGAVLLFVFWLMFKASWIFTVIGFAAVLFSIAYFAYRLFVIRDQLTIMRFNDLREKSDRQTKQELLKMKAWLSERYWEQPAEQIDRLESKRASFFETLGRKFEPMELSYSRYASVATEVHKQARENLENIITHLKAIDGIDVDKLGDEIAMLEDEVREKMGQPELDVVGLDDAVLREHLGDSGFDQYKALDARWNMREKHLLRVDDLLALNEQAMTELDNFASQIAFLDTNGVDEEKELNAAMEKIRGLGEEATKNFS